MAETTDLQRLVVSMEARYSSMERELRKANGVANKQARAIETRFSKMNANVSASFGRLALLAGTALSVRQVIGYADAWTRANNSLKVSGVAAEDVASTLDRLYNIAQGSGAALEPTVTLFSRLSQAAGELGASREQLFQFTEGIGDALKVAGTDAAAASGALLQLSQALGGSIVRAEEFNSINEGARPILQAVANGLDAAGGSVAKLRTLVNGGAVTSRAFFEAFLKGAGDLKSQAASAATTVSQALTKIDNALTKFIGETDAGLGASQRLVAGLNALADNFDHVADVALKLAAVLAAALLGRGLGRMLAVVPEAVVAMRVLVTSLRAGTVAAGGFTAALGPIGLITAAVSAAIYVFSDWSDSIDDVTRSLAQQAASGDGVEAMIRDLGRAQEDYKKAIADTAGAQVSATDSIVASTKKEFEAKQQLLALELKRQEAALALKRAALAEQAAALRSEVSRTVFTRDSAEAGGFSDPRVGRLTQLPDDITGLDKTRAVLANSPATTEITRLRAEIDLTEVSADKLREALASTFGGGGASTAPASGAGTAGGVAGGAHATTDAIDLVGDAIERNIALMDDLRDTSKDFVSTFVDGIRRGESAAEALGNAVDRLADKILDSGIDALVSQLFGPSGTAGTGILGTVASALFGGARAGGGPVSAGKAYLVGEKGPELLVPRMPGKVIKASDVAGGLRSGSSRSVTVGQVVIQTPDPAGFRRSEAQVSAMIGRAVQRSARFT